ncbi:hypothetical protein Nepgr_022851 [Nepenthes gracilis]|uniref:Uncharacterized protein n=1 Tax=Nepenthes gracilis TaxID=150966 RepID=A0AAD3T1J6_NEPGR|nr:hypothetical protein Nepgr_022851 [Nepenthes gracilis]
MNQRPSRIATSKKQEPKVSKKMKQRQLHHAYFPTPSKSATSADSPNIKDEVQRDGTKRELNVQAAKKAANHVMNIARPGRFSCISINQQRIFDAGGCWQHQVPLLKLPDLLMALLSKLFAEAGVL